MAFTGKEVLTLSAIDQHIIPAISLEDIDLLPTKAHISQMLKVFNITAETLGVYNPKMTIVLTPFPDIRLKGTHIDTSTGDVQNTLIEAAFMNLDSLPLTNVKFIRKYSEA